MKNRELTNALLALILITLAVNTWLAFLRPCILLKTQPTSSECIR